MQSAGQLLQSERLKRNKSLADIASETRISSRYLDAIERDDTSQLPGDFFYKAFLRQYASTLELDRATTDRIVASAVPTEEVDPVPAFNEAYANASTGASSRWTPPTSVAIALLVMVLAGGSGLYAWWQKAQTGKEAERFSQQTAQAGGESKSQSVTKSRSSEARPAEAMPTETRPEELKPAEAPVLLQA
ncbi:MAG: helix-turn-helix domain-containing protein [Bryobacteraceae bacterium]|nr:helix-turn-helix domain-containing protein [Bryobacteraceae bacterium]